MFNASNRAKLKVLKARLEQLIAELPGQAHALVNDAKALTADIGARQGPLSLRISARECTDFNSRLEALQGRADKLQALRQEAAPVLRAEEAHAAGLVRLDDPELRELFAALSTERKAKLAALGREEARLEGTRPGGGASLKDLDGWGRVDREFFDRFVTARERLRSVRAEDRIRALREALPSLQRRFIEMRPSLDSTRLAELLTELRTLLDPLDKFRQREKPERIDQVQKQMMRIEEWIDVLYQGGDERTPSAAVLRNQKALQTLNARYWDLTEDWQNQYDEVFDGLFEQADVLMRKLTDQAEREHAAARKRLDRNRMIYDQYGDPEINPGLAEELAALLVQTPDSPYEFGDWLDRYRRASQRFADALGGDAYQLLGFCDELRTKMIESVTGIHARPLSEPDRADTLRLENELKLAAGIATEDSPIEEVIDSLNQHRNLAERVDALCARVREKAELLCADRDAIRARAERLDTLAGALGVTPPKALHSLGEVDSGVAASIEHGNEALDRERAALRALEPELIRACCARLGQRLAALGELRELLDDDLDDGLDFGGADPSTLDPRTPPATLEQAEVLLPRLEALHQRLLAALGPQLERLRSRRATLLERSGDRIAARGRTDHDLLDDLLQPLDDFDESQFDDRLALIRQLRHLVGRVELQIRRIEHDEQAIAALRADVGDRLRALSREFPEVKSTPHHDRVRALIKEVHAAGAPREARHAQIQQADGLLRALERHASREAAHGFMSNLAIIRQLGIQDAAGSGLDVWLEKPTPHLELPDAELRQRAIDLAERHRPAP